MELLHGFGGTGGLVAIVSRNKPKLPAVHSTACVSYLECGIEAQLHFLAELLGSSAQWRRNPEQNFFVCYPLYRKRCELSRLRLHTARLLRF